MTPGLLANSLTMRNSVVVSLSGAPYHSIHIQVEKGLTLTYHE